MAANASDRWTVAVRNLDHLYCGAICSIFFFFLSSFVVFRHDHSLYRFSLISRTLFRFGWGLSSAAFVWGIIGIANGLGTPLESRCVAVVAKHQTLQRNPANRTYYLAVRPWRESKAVVELECSRTTYDQLPVPINAIDTAQKVLSEMPGTDQVILTVGKGRFGLEWLKSIEPPAKPSNSRIVGE